MELKELYLIFYKMFNSVKEEGILSLEEYYGIDKSIDKYLNAYLTKSEVEKPSNKLEEHIVYMIDRFEDINVGKIEPFGKFPYWFFAKLIEDNVIEYEQYILEEIK